MYTDEDLNLAVKKGILTAVSVNEFKQLMLSLQASPIVDEDNFKLSGGVNGIFVVLACCVLLFSSLFVLTGINPTLAKISFVVIAWGLAEFFVLKRKMSLPAIVLLITFVWGVFSLVTSFFTHSMSENALMAGAGVTAIATYFHWLRFKVPITVAAGTVAVIALFIVSTLKQFPSLHHWIFILASFCGVASFCLAMVWDSADTKRLTGKADVAFWLHLVSAPLIIHPIFIGLGVLEGNESIFNMVVVLVLYILMTIVSIVIDRRAFMVSSLVYVIYALSSIIDIYGGIGYSFAITGVLMGAILLLLSAFWLTVRGFIVGKLPQSMTSYIPSISKT